MIFTPAATVAFYQAECLRIHALCDQCQVPREEGGEPLSISERVAVLAAVSASLIRSLGYSPTTH